jgi:SRSO17 transposase
VLSVRVQYDMDADATRRLGEYFAEIGDVLGHKKRRASFATYALGLLGDGDRKSMEPIAARACGDRDETDAYHQRIQLFITDSAWSDRNVRRVATDYGLSAMTEREPVEAWIIDDTGFLKQGKHSVGVQRQYTGSAGKVANCQIGVSLSIATRTEHLPIDFELYLPKCWTENPARRKEAKIPDDVPFKTKNQLALAMVHRAVEEDRPRGVVLADSAYGDDSSFRAQLRQLGLHYAVEVKDDKRNRVWRVDKAGRRRGEPITVRALADKLGRKSFRRVTWREGTNSQLSARFALQRVVPAYAETGDDRYADREPVWLLVEWRDDESEPTRFHFVSMPTVTRKRLVRLVKQRWRTERVYEDLKGQLGLDHFEGRRFRGWHHHVSVALCCFAFVVAERVRSFSPSARGEAGDHAVPCAA